MAWYSTLPWIVAQANAAAEQPAVDEVSVVIRLLAVVGILAGSFVVGNLIARGLRLPDFSFRIGIVLLTLIAGVVICVVGWPPKRGIDLSGGVVLVYEVDTASTKPSWMPAAVAQLNDALSSQEGPKIVARAGQGGNIEVVVPEGADPSRVDRAVLGLRASDNLVLHRAGQRNENASSVLTYAADEEHKAVEMENLITAVSRRINPGGVKELTIRQYGAEQLEVIIPEVETSEVEQIKKRISTSGLLEFRIAANENDDRDIIRAANRTPGADVYLSGKLVGRWVKAAPDLNLPASSLTAFRETPNGGREVLVRIDRHNVDGGNLDRALRGYDEGKIAVDFSFDNDGSERFGRLTRDNLPDKATDFYRHLGIVLDNVMLSAPTIEETIRGRGQIKGDFTEQYVDFLVEVLNAGSLPATLRPEPISEQRISAQLGEDTIRRGTLAMGVSTAVILVFMVFYYRFAGVVADLAVVLNLVITIALMILIKAAFTLPGLAGLVLTVGMAVDANVLIYERMREELERGASLRMAIRNGFSRAMSTIIDSNLTTVLTGIVLYAIGTDQIKGFAVTLILGLIVSMFTAIFVSRLLFDIAERKRWITELRMMKFVGKTNINFIRWRVPAIVASSILVAIGLVAAAARGKELLDIDFTGGSSVHVRFDQDKPQSIAEVRAKVASLPDVAVSSVGEENLEFKVDTSEGDIDKVEKVLQTAFKNSLQTYSMSFGELATIEAAEPAAASDADKAKAETGPQITAPADDSKPVEPKAGEAKSDQPPAETPAPAEPKADETKPDAPKAESAAEPKAPAADDAAKPEPPADGANPDSATGRGVLQHRLPTTSLVGRLTAWFLFGQVVADPPATEKQEPADAPKAEEQPADAAKAKSEPAAEPPAPTPSADAPAAEAKADAPTADNEAPAAADKDAPPTTEKPAGAPAAAPTPSETDATLDNPLIGGTRVTLTFPQKISHDTLRERIDERLTAMGVKEAYYVLSNPAYKSGSDASYTTWTLEISLDKEQTGKLLTDIQQRLAETPVFPSSNRIGGKVAGNTQFKAVLAMLASLVMIVVYVWVRFQNVVFGVAAVLALLHDVLISVAFLALSAYLSPYLGFILVDPFKISLAVVAALLTIVGFSINDTIVIFDRIREVRGKSPELTEEMVNLSINQTLSRTIITSATVLMASLILYFVGGPGIHAFAYTMVVGVIAGTYSTVYIAAPVVLWFRRGPKSATRPARAGRSYGAEAPAAPRGA